MVVVIVVMEGVLLVVASQIATDWIRKYGEEREKKKASSTYSVKSFPPESWLRNWAK